MLRASFFIPNRNTLTPAGSACSRRISDVIDHSYVDVRMWRIQEASA
jgi:hypothetical protein